MRPLRWDEFKNWLTRHGVPDEPLDRSLHIEVVVSDNQVVVVIEFVPDPPRATRRGDALTETRYYPLEVDL